MRHHNYNPEFQFYKEPIEFNKYTPKETLQYCLGANMYMPGIKDFTQSIFLNKMPGLTCITMCFEDACREEDVPAAEENVLHFLGTISEALEENVITYANLPIVLIRIRTYEQFERFAERLHKKHLKVLCGFNFPKFNSEDGKTYYSLLSQINTRFGEKLYGLPIIESRDVAFMESRQTELMAIKTILDQFKDLVLNVRVGATDFSSCFGVRRGIDYTIYDIMAVRGCLSDILNVFSRDNDYVLSGPVWEYFRQNKNNKFEELHISNLNHSLMTREPIINDAVDGLLREIIIDKANGFVGKTVIHPTHIKYANALQAVVREEYEDAYQILHTSGGVIKSEQENKMNEIKPHSSWAYKTLKRAEAFGVIQNETDYIKLFSVNN